jgi:hypothetical protein
VAKGHRFVASVLVLHFWLTLALGQESALWHDPPPHIFGDSYPELPS